LTTEWIQQPTCIELDCLTLVRAIEGDEVWYHTIIGIRPTELRKKGESIKMGSERVLTLVIATGWCPAVHLSSTS
jgi:catechol-2,3-dioxygenase